jgi:hypothetical protein
MTKKEVIAHLETILSETKLPAKCGKYAFADRAGWFYRHVRGKLETIVKALKNEG